VLTTYTLNPSNGWDVMSSISINPLDSKIWIVGSVSMSEGRIEILDQDFALIRSKNIDSSAHYLQVVFDEVGNAYTITGVELLKVSPELLVIRRNSEII